MSERRLPDGWRWVRLEDVGYFESGGTPAKENADYWGGNIPFVTGADITDFYISQKHARAFLTIRGLESGKTAVCNPNTILFVTRTRVGRIGIATETMGASQDLSPYICGPKLLPEYAARYLSSISDYLLANCRGATIQGLTRDFVSSLSIPLPPIPEQRRIAAILTEQMDAIEQARAAAEAELAAAEALTAAYLREVFESEAARGWPRVRLGKLTTEGICNGAFKYRHEFGQGVPFVNVSDLFRSFEVDFSAVERVAASENEIERFGLYPGDLLFCRSSVKREGIGHICVVGVVPEPSIFDCHIMRVRVDQQTVLPEYVAHYWSQPSVRTSVIENAKTATMTTMNQRDLAEVEIPIAPLDEQESIIQYLSGQQVVIQDAQAALQEQLDLINTLPAALLRRAFNGEL